MWTDSLECQWFLISKITFFLFNIKELNRKMEKCDYLYGQ